MAKPLRPRLMRLQAVMFLLTTAPLQVLSLDYNIASNRDTLLHPLRIPLLPRSRITMFTDRRIQRGELRVGLDLVVSRDLSPRSSFRR